MMKAFSKVYSNWKITVFPALEGYIMFPVCFTDWFFIPVFSVCICVYVFFFFFMYHGTRADINECEQVPKPCAYQCFNTPGSFKCICPPGQHLLGDGKSCAGLERLPNYGGQYNSYNLARFSPMRNNYQPQQHYRQYSHLYSSYSEYRKSRTSLSRTRRTIRKTCPEGSEASLDSCVGKCQPHSISFLWVLLRTKFWADVQHRESLGAVNCAWFQIWDDSKLQDIYSGTYTYCQFSHMSDILTCVHSDNLLF